MAGWYKTTVKDNIDVGQAVRDAGKMGEAVSYLGNSIKNYGDDKYKKKRALVDDDHKRSDRQGRQNVANTNAKGKTDTASINKSSSDNANASKEKVAKIKFDSEKYKSDSSYKEKIDKERLTNKGKSITAGAKDRATVSTASNQKLSAKTQIDVANINSTAKTVKAKNTKIKKQAASLNLSEDMSLEDVKKQLNASKKIVDFDI